MLESNQKLAVLHVVFATRPSMLRKRLESDLDFAHSELRKNVKDFMKHALAVPEAFEKVDNDPSSDRGNNTKNKPNTRGDCSSSSVAGGSQAGTASGNQDPDSEIESGKTSMSSRSILLQRPPPPCPFPPYKKKDLKHWIDDSETSTGTEKLEMKSELAIARARDGPAWSTREQQKSVSSVKSTDTRRYKTFGRLAATTTNTRAKRNTDTPSCAISLADGALSVDVTG